MMGDDQEYYDDGVNFSYMDNLPFSMEKLSLARVSAPEGQQAPLIWNFMKYHGRWHELEDRDWINRADLHDPLKGYVLLPDRQAETPVLIPPKEGESSALLEKNVAWLEKIIELCKERGVKLWLIKSPSNTALEQTQRLRMEEVAALAAVTAWNLTTSTTAMKRWI
ncbi:MAG: hypothetical protein QM813_24385 [Verrucomicrobiota bacterium]